MSEFEYVWTRNVRDEFGNLIEMDVYLDVEYASERVAADENVGEPGGFDVDLMHAYIIDTDIDILNHLQNDILEDIKNQIVKKLEED